VRLRKRWRDRRIRQMYADLLLTRIRLLDAWLAVNDEEYHGQTDRHDADVVGDTAASDKRDRERQRTRASGRLGQS